MFCVGLSSRVIWFGLDAGPSSLNRRPTHGSILWIRLSIFGENDDKRAVTAARKFVTNFKTAGHPGLALTRIARFRVCGLADVRPVLFTSHT